MEERAYPFDLWSWSSWVASFVLRTCWDLTRGETSNFGLGPAPVLLIALLTGHQCPPIGGASLSEPAAHLARPFSAPVQVQSESSQTQHPLPPTMVQA